MDQHADHRPQHRRAARARRHRLEAGSPGDRRIDRPQDDEHEHGSIARASHRLQRAGDSAACSPCCGRGRSSRSRPRPRRRSTRRVYVGVDRGRGCCARRTQAAVDVPTCRPRSGRDRLRRPLPARRPRRTALFVKGTGVVTDVNLQSRVGQALVRLDGGASAGHCCHPSRARAPRNRAARCARLRPLHRLRQPVRLCRRCQRTERSRALRPCSDRSMHDGLAGAARLVHRRRGRRRSDARRRRLEIVPVRLSVGGRGGR